MTNEQLETATAMRASGATYKAIGEALGVSAFTIQYWLNSDYRAKNRKRKQTPAYRKQQREYKRNINATFEGRCRQALSNSRHASNKHGHVACNATVEQLIEAFTGCCDICGVTESERPKRLEMDHCHSAGNFRGWLCGLCNQGLGKLKDDVGAILAYLDPYNAQRLLGARIQDFRRAS